MIPIDCKIGNFFLYLFVCFKKIPIIISWCAPNCELVENPLASTLHIHSFQPSTQRYNGEQHDKYLYNNPAIMENTECSIAKARASFINLKVGVSLDLYHYALLCF